MISQFSGKLLILVMALGMVGCSVNLIPESQPQRVFTLPYDYQPRQQGGSGNGALPPLRVVRPQANGVLDGESIVIETGPNELAVYSDVNWMTNAPVLLRDHLVRALRADPAFATVSSDTSSASSEVSLTSNLLAFQANRHDTAPHVEVYLQAQLVENGSRRTLSTRDFEIQVPVNGSGIEAVVNAFGRASDRLAGELADWTATVLADY